MKRPFTTRHTFMLLCIIYFSNAIAQNKDALIYNLNADGSHYIRFTMLNQTWVRFNQSNLGTTVDGLAKPSTFDIGLRRTRFQMFGKIGERTFIYFQYGQNNFNALFNAPGNRKWAAFFHDALCEYQPSNGNQLKLGGGLTITNGLSRFSQPGISSSATMDVPIFAQTTVDQIDEFSRKLSVYARGQLGKWDYRLILSDPFPIASAGITLPPINANATFAQKGRYLQQQAYIMYQFFDHEQHATPYMAGTYLGKKRIWNIAMGAIYQPKAMWRISNTDTLYSPMQHFAIESFLDLPLSPHKNDMINAYLGFFKTNYGPNYLRFNGIMNPANGTTLTVNETFQYQGATYGNALPMFGTGNVMYAQLAYLLPSARSELNNRWMPYAACTLAQYERLNNQTASTFNVGINWLIHGHNAKLSLDWQNRQGWKIENQTPVKTKRLQCFVLQYQLFI